MKKPGDDVLLRLPGDGAERILHRALVLEWRGDGATLSTSANQLPVEEGNELLVYYTHGKAFVQQPIHVDSTNIQGKHLIIEYTTQGDPISAESRENFRVLPAKDPKETLDRGLRGLTQDAQRDRLRLIY